MGYSPEPEEIREEIEDEGHDLSDEEWESVLEDYEAKFGKFGDDGFVAWATAYVEYGVKIDADYALPGGGGSSGGSSGGSGLPDQMDTYKIDSLNEVDHQDEEQIEVSGWVMDMWDDVSGNNNRQKKLRIRDDTGATTMMATGDSNVENLVGANIESGDFVRFRGANVFHPDDSDYYGLTIPYWAEIDFPDSDYELADTAKDYIRDVVNEGDFVHVSGLVTDTQFNEYTGCAECMTKWDPEDEESERVCPNCSHDEATTYRPGRVSITAGDETATISFSPSDEPPEDDIMFQEFQALGEYEVSEYNETEFREIAVEFFEEVEDLDDVGPDTTEEPSSDTTEESSDESSDSSSGDLPEEVQKIKEKIEDFGYEMPAMAGIRVLQKELGISDEDEQVEIMQQLRDVDSITVTEDEATIEDREWNSVMLDAA